MKINPIVFGLITALMIVAAITAIVLMKAPSAETQKAPVYVEPHKDEVKTVKVPDGVVPEDMIREEVEKERSRDRIIVSPSGGIIHCSGGVCIDYSSGQIGFEMFP